MIADALRPETVGGEDDAARILNHDLRSLLTVILGYSDDLRRVAGKYFLDDFVPEIRSASGPGPSDPRPGRQHRHPASLLGHAIRRLTTFSATSSA